MLNTPYKRLRRLWITHVRLLAQELHEIICDQPLAASNVPQIRRGVARLLRYMARLLYFHCSAADTADHGNLSRYHVPDFATLAFAMAERFISRFEFEGDEDAAFRHDLFEALDLLQCSMIAASGYASSPYDAPEFLSGDPSEYSIGTRTKHIQVVELDSEFRHAFGCNLKRYQEAQAGFYEFPRIPDEDRFVPTRPNTPDLYGACGLTRNNISM
ncbi:hypothetical protein R3P38DRAFT_2524740 [Favolaschia claudopus]|uniref:Uncharacterized protein n=1 Tax=Favolaschia claudopus TaxID=2862362 RepID=A0AAW0BRU1_9AGAR